MSEFPKVKYSSIAPDVSAVFELPLLSEVTRLAGRAGSVETGGILVGEYFDGGRSVRITEVTAMPEDSRFGRAWFKRGRKGLDALLRDRWGQGQYYVGEWHSHPGGSAEPSGSDIAAMRKPVAPTLPRCGKSLATRCIAARRRYSSS
ncbi:Mov34/MPN/PAD-1 family protein [Mesorhizobium sp. M0491]|uniref:Mov34/MPN/PAD-1 family protein n=1 Tax=Mesorhizobium sp. M0491 TaxID=2956950 RepID=UPI003334E7FC